MFYWEWSVEFISLPLLGRRINWPLAIKDAKSSNMVYNTLPGIDCWKKWRFKLATRWNRKCLEASAPSDFSFLYNFRNIYDILLQLHDQVCTLKASNSMVFIPWPHILPLHPRDGPNNLRGSASTGRQSLAAIDNNLAPYHPSAGGGLFISSVLYAISFRTPEEENRIKQYTNSTSGQSAVRSRAGGAFDFVLRFFSPPQKVTFAAAKVRVRKR